MSKTSTIQRFIIIQRLKLIFALLKISIIFIFIFIFVFKFKSFNALKLFVIIKTFSFSNMKFNAILDLSRKIKTVERTLKAFIKNVMNDQNHDDELKDDVFRNRKKFIIILMFKNNEYN